MRSPRLADTVGFISLTFVRYLRCGCCGRLLQVWQVAEENQRGPEPEWYAAEAEERLPPRRGETIALFEHEVLDRLGPMHMH